MTLDPSTEIGLLLRELREERTLTMRQVGERAYISIGHISEVERGVKTPSMSALTHWADGLGMRVSDLLIELGFRLAEKELPDTPAELVVVRDDKWSSQYSDLVG